MTTSHHKTFISICPFFQELPYRWAASINQRLAFALFFLFSLIAFGFGLLGFLKSKGKNRDVITDEGKTETGLQHSGDVFGHERQHANTHKRKRQSVYVQNGSAT